MKATMQRIMKHTDWQVMQAALILDAAKIKNETIRARVNYIIREGGVNVVDSESDLKKGVTEAIYKSIESARVSCFIGSMGCLMCGDHYDTRTQVCKWFFKRGIRG